jgi:hypothetical protein
MRSTSLATIRRPGELQVDVILLQLGKLIRKNNCSR